MRLALRLPTRFVPRPRLPGAQRPGRRRARAVVLSGAAAVVAALGGLGLAVETTRPHWRDPEYGHRLKQLRALDRWRRQAAPARPLVVLVGSSRAALGLSPAHLGFDESAPAAPVVYNFAHSGYGPGGELVSVRRLLDHGLVPDRLLVEIMPPSLAVPEVPDPVPPPGSLSLRETRHLAAHHARPGRAVRGWAAGRAWSWYTLRHSLLSHAGLGGWLPEPYRKDFLWEQLRPSGWMPWEPGPVGPGWRAANRDRARAAHADIFTAFHVAPAQDRVVRDILRTAAAAGVPTALFVMPESPAFRGWYPPGGRELVRDYLAALSREYGVPVFDASGWVDDEDAYSDGHHLLAPAAEAFSRRFGRECVGPWVGAAPAGGD